MSAPAQIFEFDGYRLRPATEADRDLAQLSIDADADHRGRMGGPYWTEQGAGIDSYVLEHEDGRTALFFRMERLARLHVQFVPGATKEENRRALESGTAWLAMAVGRAGFLEMIFGSTSKLLRRFCTGRLGFHSEPDTLSRRLVLLPPRPTASPDSKQQG